MQLHTLMLQSVVEALMMVVNLKVVLLISLIVAMANVFLLHTTVTDHLNLVMLSGDLTVLMVLMKY